jgi:uncharacterized protein YuzE
MSYTQNKVSYDKKYDVLYFSLEDNDNSYGDEIEDNIVFMKDIDTNEITGITVMGFLRYFSNTPERLDSLKPFLDVSEIANKCANM